MNVMRAFPPVLRFFLSKTARNTYLVFIGNILSMTFSFFFTILLVRTLSVSDFGYFSALFSFLLLVTDMSDFGIGSSLSRFLPPLRHEKEKLFQFIKTAFVVQITIGSILMVAVFSLSPVLSAIIFHDLIFTPFLRVISVGVFGTIVMNFFLFTLLARQRFVFSSLYTVLMGAARLLFLGILFLFSAVSLRTVIWGQVTSIVVLMFIGFFLVEREFFGRYASKHDAKRLVSFSFFLGVARALTTVAGKIDVLMIIALTNSVEAGIYATASRVISIYPLLAGSFITVVAPKIAEITDRKQLKRTILMISFGTLGFVFSLLFLILFARPFLLLLFGEKALEAVAVFRVLLLSMVFFVGSIPSVTLAIYYLKKPHILTVNSVVQITLVVVANSFFIPIFGRLGAAYSLVLAYASTFFLTSFMTYASLVSFHSQRREI